MKVIVYLLISTLFASCSVLSKKTLKVDTQVLKEIWEGDPCGKYGNRDGISLLIVDLCNKKQLDIVTTRYILGTPARIDTFKNNEIGYSFIVSSATKGCDTMLYNDIVHIGLRVFYNFKKDKIIGCQTNIY